MKGLLPEELTPTRHSLHLIAVMIAATISYVSNTILITISDCLFVHSLVQNQAQGQQVGDMGFYGWKAIKRGRPVVAR